MKPSTEVDFPALRYRTSRRVHGASRAGMFMRESIAILMAGPPTHICKLGVSDPMCRMNNASFQVSRSLFGELDARILRPTCAAGIELGMFIACDSGEKDGWESMLHWMLSSGRRCVGAHVVGAYSAREPTIEQSVFGALPTHAAYNDRMQFAHLAEAWLLMRKHEELVNRKYTWVLRTRNDLVYRPDFIFQPGWLTTLPADSLSSSGRRVTAQVRDAIFSENAFFTLA